MEFSIEDCKKPYFTMFGLGLLMGAGDGVLMWKMEVTTSLYCRQENSADYCSAKLWKLNKLGYYLPPHANIAQYTRRGEVVTLK
jgi:hypothetical protein